MQIGGMLFDSEDPAFTVEAQGLLWSVYRFTARGKRGTLAFTRQHERDGRWVIGLLTAGELTPDEVAAELSKASIDGRL